MTADSFYLFVRIAGKTVEGNHNGLPEIAQVTDVFVKIAEAFLQSFHVRLLDTVETDTTVHLQSLCSGDDNGQLGLQTAFAAFDIIELLRSQVRTEAGFGHYVIAEGHSHFGSENGVAAMRYICERTAMHKSGCSFGGLYQVGMNGIFQQYGDGARHT